MKKLRGLRLSCNKSWWSGIGHLLRMSHLPWVQFLAFVMVKVAEIYLQQGTA